MKKILVALMGLLMAFSLAACGGMGTTNSSKNSSSIRQSSVSSKSKSSSKNSSKNSSKDSSKNSSKDNSSEDGHVHSLTKTAATAASCTEDGNIEYWTCECGKIFSDAAGSKEISLADTVVVKTGHDFSDDGVCECGVDVNDKNAWVTAGENCAEVTYTEGLGWKATASESDKYYLEVNADIIAYYMEQGNNYLTLSFGEAFDGADYGNDNPLNCFIWILPVKADGTEDWEYAVSRKMQTELDKTEEGVYFHALNLTDETYDYAKYGFKLYVDNVAANTGGHVGAIYLSDISYAAQNLHTHDFSDDGVCECGVAASDKNYWITAGANCGEITYTEGKGWKATSATEDKFFLHFSGEFIAYYMAQGNDQLTVSFSAPFDGADYGENSPLKCFIWIVPITADGVENWEYTVSRKMQVDLDYNANGTYYHTLNLADETYDYAQNGFIVYVDNVAANTGEHVGAIYITDVSYSVKPDPMDKNGWIKTGENCGSVEYTEGLGWKATAATATNYYIKFNHEVTAAYMEEGCDQMTITFSAAFDGADYGNSNPLNCRIWILPPKAPDGGNDWSYSVSQKMQTELTKNADGTYSHTLNLINEYEGYKIYDFANFDLTIYVDNKAANTGEHVGSIYIKSIEYSQKPILVEPEKADYFAVNEGCESVTYTEGLGWKAQAATGAEKYYFKLRKEVTAYYIEQGYDKVTISFGSAFDGTVHEGRPTVCRIWLLPTKDGGGNDWGYTNGGVFIHNLTAQMDGTYAFTIDLTEAKYDFVDYDFNFYVDTVDGGNMKYVGACYVYDVSFEKSEVVEEESYLGGVKLYQMGTTNSQLSMGYVMVTEANEVIVIDSGRNAEEGKVLYDFIVEIKGSAVVDAWYLSHYHGDHIEALTQILNTYDITINNLYFDFPTDKALIEQYGDGDNVFLYDFYDALEKNASKVKNIVTPKKGDVFTYTGLEMRVLNDALFGEGMKYVNNSSVVYKAVTPDESVLFLGDMGDYGMTLLNDSYFKSEIETCTVVQMAHHGNSDLLGSFYDNIKEIKVALFPCLAWVFNNDAGSGFNSGTMTTVQTRQYLDSRGVKIMLTQVNGMVTLE